MIENARIVRTVPWWLRSQFGAITLGNTIHVRPDIKPTQRLIAHELVHVEQWNRYGKIGFLTRYAWGFITKGFNYWTIPIEVEAYKKEREEKYLQAAKKLLEDQEA